MHLCNKYVYNSLDAIAPFSAIHELIYISIYNLAGGCYCSETVKFGHVTFVWNGNRSGQFSNTLEKYVEIPSDSGISFNQEPKMKAIEIAEKAAEALRSGEWDQVYNIDHVSTMYRYWKVQIKNMKKLLIHTAFSYTTIV